MNRGADRGGQCHRSEEIVEVIPSYFVEQIVAGATDNGGNCGGASVF